MRKNGKIVNCLTCNKELYYPKCYIGIRKYCSRKCYDNSPVRTRKPHTQKTKTKISIAHKKYCKLHTVWNKGLLGFRKGWKHTEEHKKYMSELKKKTQFKENNPSWKGGITPLQKMIRESEEYENWRKAIYTRDYYKCIKCGEGKKLNSHHIVSFRDIFKEFLQEYSQFSPIEDKETLLRLSIKYKPFWDLNNGKTLCEKCHKSTISYLNHARNL